MADSCGKHYPFYKMSLPQTLQCQYEKRDGSITFAKNRIFFCNKDDDNKVFNVEYNEISKFSRSSKKEGAVKMTFRIVATNNKNYDINFNGKTCEEQISEAIKLGKIVKSYEPPQSNANESPEERIRNSIKEDNPTISSLHLSLVPDILNEEEFWTNFELESTKKFIELLNEYIGYPSSDVSAIKPITSGGTNTNLFKLDNQMLHQIFRKHPSLYQSFKNAMSKGDNESQFFRRYFKEQSHNISEDQIVFDQIERKKRLSDIPESIRCEDLDFLGNNRGIHSSDDYGINLKSNVIKINNHSELVLVAINSIPDTTEKPLIAKDSESETYIATKVLEPLDDLMKDTQIQTLYEPLNYVIHQNDRHDNELSIDYGEHLKSFGNSIAKYRQTLTGDFSHIRQDQTEHILRCMTNRSFSEQMFEATITDEFLKQKLLELQVLLFHFYRLIDSPNPKNKIKAESLYQKGLEHENMVNEFIRNNLMSSPYFDDIKKMYKKMHEAHKMSQF